MRRAYTEEQLVEQPAIGLFAELGWTTGSALEETFGATGTLLRETKGKVVLVSPVARGVGAVKSRAAARSAGRHTRSGSKAGARRRYVKAGEVKYWFAS